MAQTWNDAKLQKVFYSVGEFSNDQAPRFIDAPFDVVKINGKIYLQPKSFRIVTESLAQGVATDAEQARFARQEFYTERDALTVEEHQMGCKDDTTWLGVHRFGWC